MRKLKSTLADENSLGLGLLRSTLLGVTLLSFAMGAGATFAQAPAVTTPASSAALPAVATLAPAAPPSLASPGAAAAMNKGSGSAKIQSAPTRSDWKDLTDAQKTTLKPLEANWASMSVGHKNKWIALAKDLPTLKPADQARLTARMTDWASLSAQQRAQARLNFADAQTDLSDAERKAKWAAYQALSADEKRRLKTEGSLGQTRGAATAIRPSPEKLANVPGSAPAARLAASGTAKARTAASGGSAASGRSSQPALAGAMPPASGAMKRSPRIAIAGSTASAPPH